MNIRSSTRASTPHTLTPTNDALADSKDAEALGFGSPAALFVKRVLFFIIFFWGGCNWNPRRRTGLPDGGLRWVFQAFLLQARAEPTWGFRACTENTRSRNRASSNLARISCSRIESFALEFLGCCWGGGGGGGGGRNSEAQNTSSPCFAEQGPSRR